MEEYRVYNLPPGEAQQKAKTATDREIFDAIMQGYSSCVRVFAPHLFIDDATRQQFAEGGYLRNPVTFCDVYMAREQLSIAEAQKQLAESQKQLAEQQTAIAERQEEIAKQIKRSVDESTEVAKEVRELTVTIKKLTWAMLVLTAIAVIAAIASIWK